LRFPSADSVLHPGFDGVCELNERQQLTSYVPFGRSVWEISTQRKQVRQKADRDYSKRSLETPPVERERTTFVFVTPRRWSKKLEWMARHKSERKWADVRVYDADDLVHWIEIFPAVGDWLAVTIGKRPPAVRQLRELWEEWSLSTKWPMTRELVLADRDEDAVRILRWLREEPSCLALQADSPAEAMAFLYAAIDQLPEPYRTYFQELCVAAGTSDAARILADSPSPLIIGLEDADPGLINVIAQKGHHVFLAYGSSVGAPRDVIRLTRPSREAIVHELQFMLVEPAQTETIDSTKDATRLKAQRLARDSARSLSVLRRLIPAAPGAQEPDWAKAGSDLIGPLFAGTWDDSYSGDRDALGRLMNIGYEAGIGRFIHRVNLPDSPIRKAGNAWKMASPLDAWFRLARFATNYDLERFRNVASVVLRSLDPRFELDSEQRWLAPLHGKRPEYSNLLKTGLLETLVLLSLFGEQTTGVVNPSHLADLVVSDLLDNADRQRWWSLSDQLQLLAEAAPGVFLEAVDRSLRRNDAPILELFKEDTGGVFGAAYHSNLLWALEALAWSPIFLAHVAELLAKLDTHDPGGRWANRPGRSLREIFLLWYPQTNATLDEREQVLEGLRSRQPRAAWKLMLGILPKGHDTATPAAQPRFRDFSVDAPEQVTRNLIFRGADKISEWLLSDVGEDVARWKDLIQALTNLAPDRREEAENMLIEVAHKLTSNEERVSLWTSIRKLLSHHRSFPDAAWALPSEELDTIENAYNALEPAEYLERIVWLFSGFDSVALPRPTGKGWEKDRDLTLEMRRHALKDLLSSTQNTDAIFSLAERAETPFTVGLALVDSTVPRHVVDDIFLRAVKSSVEEVKELARGIIAGSAQRSNGAIWVDNVLRTARSEEWPAETVVEILLALPPTQELWAQAAEFGTAVEDLYWSKVGLLPVGKNEQALIFALAKLLSGNRARVAVHLAGMYVGKVPADLLAKVLEQAAREKWPTKIEGNEATILQYRVEEILQALDKSDAFPAERLAILEWTYLPLLRYGRRRPVALHNALASDASFFVGVLSQLYRPDPESGIESEPSTEDPEQAKLRASYAFDLLNSWQTVPGSAGNTVDPVALKRWVNQSRLLCEKVGRLRICDHQIGRVLAYAPTDVDSIWPVTAVRELIEEVASRDLDTGLVVGVHNKGGVTSRGPTEGGDRERALAEDYRRASRMLAIRWPRTSSVLEQIAKGFDSSADFHDQQAERFQW
jgi:hypothetical protein